MQKRTLLFLSLLLVFIAINLSACGKKPKNNNDITNYLKNIESYTTEMNIVIKNDKQTISHKAKQSYLKGGGYKLELNEDRVFIYKADNNIYIYDKNNETKYTQVKEFDEVLKLCFIGEYIGLLYTNDEIKYTLNYIKDIEYTVIDLFVPGNNKNINNALLYVNNKTMIPEKLVIYDVTGKEKLEVLYTNFLPNVKIEAAEFLVQ